MTIDTTRLSVQLRDVLAVTLPTPLKVSLNDLIVKGVALALTQRPEVNVSFDGEQLLFKQQINIGIAVALPEGLIVPATRRRQGPLHRTRTIGWWRRHAPVG